MNAIDESQSAIAPVQVDIGAAELDGGAGDGACAERSPRPASDCGVDASTVFRIVAADRALARPARCSSARARATSPTELAQSLAEQAERVESALEAARAGGQRAAGPGRAARCGSRRPTPILHGLVAPALKALRRDHPLLGYELHTGNELANLTRRDADIAVRATKRPPQHLVGRHLGPIRVALYAARKSRIRRLDDVERGRAAWIAPDDALPEHPSVVWRRKHFPKVVPALSRHEHPHGAGAGRARRRRRHPAGLHRAGAQRPRRADRPARRGADRPLAADARRRRATCAASPRCIGTSRRRCACPEAHVSCEGVAVARPQRAKPCDASRRWRRRCATLADRRAGRRASARRSRARERRRTRDVAAKHQRRVVEAADEAARVAAGGVQHERREERAGVVVVEDERRGRRTTRRRRGPRTSRSPSSVKPVPTPPRSKLPLSRSAGPIALLSTARVAAGCPAPSASVPKSSV